MPESTQQRNAKLLELMVRDNRRCHYCGREVYLDLPPNEPLAATRDHIVPVSKGGSSKLFNLVLCCQRCNVLKGSLPWHLRCEWCETARSLHGICETPGHSRHQKYNCKDNWYKVYRAGRVHSLTQRPMMRS